MTLPALVQIGPLAYTISDDEHMPMFLERADGVYLTEPWPERWLFTDEFLTTDVYPWVAVGDGIVTFTVRNGTASYGLQSFELLRNVHHGLLGPGATYEAADL